MLSMLSSFASYVILTMPDEIEGTSLIDHWAYVQARDVAIGGLFLALFCVAFATSFVAMMNPFSGLWEDIAVFCLILVLFIFVIIIWLGFGKCKANVDALPQ